MSVQVVAPLPAVTAPPALSAFELLVKKNELKSPVPEKLKNLLSTCKIVLLCDDSSSMANTISEEGSDPFAAKKSTRWLELKKLAAVIIEFVTAINPEGLDIHFLNRGIRYGVKDMTGLQLAFSDGPNGSTPLISKIRSVHDEYAPTIGSKQLLLVVITDGEPSDGSRQDLFNVLMYVTRSGNVHVSFAECTDKAEDMEYLDAWDGRIPNFDNTDDYREELQRVKTAMGRNFKFDYTDYVIKILLATFDRWYYNLDQRYQQSYAGQPGCCIIL